ncbi:MAG: DmsE family decaheme c-type cytochrome [Acidobacteria bacterium]|nr:DmsE family decaheme c-type cytochrome [Acidobacteriota bacterium]
MTARRFLFCVATLTYLLALTLASAAVTADAQAASASAIALDAQTSAPATPPGYVGTDTCVACHEDQQHGYEAGPHGKTANPRSPAARQGCESCHGPGERHIDDPSNDTTLRKFAKMAPRDVSATCITCHAGGSHAAWQGSPHDTRNLSCVTCHSVHAPRSPSAHLKTNTEVELCATCHRVQANKLKRVSHMPVQEGKLQCSSCHNPHGSTNVKQLRVGNWINESCVSCHTEKRGPFLFEHAAGRESCVSCHDPHGSSNDRLLVAKVPMLCQRCHIGTRHPSTLYDNVAVEAKTVRIIGRGCVNCHSQVHGSNHPSGQALIR